MNRRKQLGSVTYSTDREDEANKIVIISLLSVFDGFGKQFVFTRNGLKWPKHVESKTSQFRRVRVLK